MTAALVNNYGPPPVTFVKGQGAELFDESGKRYLDFLCGLAVTSLGHADPDVTKTLTTQADTLIHTSNLFGNEPTSDVVTIIDSLIRGMPIGGEAGDASSEPGRVLFQNSGAEAIEAAIKLVRRYHGHGKHKIISAYGSFHGRTMAALAATGQPEKHEPFQPLPEGFAHVAFNDVDALEAALDPSVGAVLLESVQGEGGVNPASDDYLRAVRELCDERGILLVFDEIQTGFGRTGKWFGFQHAGVTPDIVTMAKAMGNGFPVGALWATATVAAAFQPGDHGSTFAGQPLALAVVRTVLNKLMAMNAPEVAQTKGAALSEMLQGVDGVSEVRGKGLLLAAELTADALGERTAKDVAKTCLEMGLVVNGVTQTALRLAPPFIVTTEQCQEAVDMLKKALG